MTAATRYLFDLDFDAELRTVQEEEAEPTISLYEHEALMAALERKVRQEAHAEGHKQAIDEGAMALSEETQRLTGVTTTLLNTLDTEIREREHRAIRVAISTAKKLSGRLMEREPIGEVEDLFHQALSPLLDTSHLVIRMHEAHLDEVRERLEAIAEKQGFEGRLVFMADPEFAPGDARVEWADGGVSRRQSEIEASVDQLIENYLGPPPAEPSQQDVPPTSVSKGDAITDEAAPETLKPTDEVTA
ncbi:MAG: FliH/SctL family protein [Pseudomonadota bacterium]